MISYSVFVYIIHHGGCWEKWWAREFGEKEGWREERERGRGERERFVWAVTLCTVFPWMSILALIISTFDVPWRSFGTHCSDWDSLFRRQMIIMSSFDPAIIRDQAVIWERALKRGNMVYLFPRVQDSNMILYQWYSRSMPNWCSFLTETKCILFWRERDTHTETDRNRQTDRQTDRQLDRWANHKRWKYCCCKIWISNKMQILFWILN